MYNIHNLRANIQEWKGRISKSNAETFGNEIKFFIDNLQDNKITSAIIAELCLAHPYDDTEIANCMEQERRNHPTFHNTSSDRAAFCFQQILFLSKQSGGYQRIHGFHIFQGPSGSGFNGTKENMIIKLIAPIVNFLHDKLDATNSVIYLLEKYKKRTEWFTKSGLIEKYRNVKQGGKFEGIFEDDLRLFLFDQGIEYPFSTPQSVSGRADVVGAIDTEDPLIVEIKIIDKEKGYGKNRIQEGFTQIVQYANDYNKDFGYLVLYNIDKAQVNFKLSEPINKFPTMIRYHGKIFFIIIVNLFSEESASKQGKTYTIEVTEEELTNPLTE